MSNTSRIARQRIIYTVTPREPVGLLYLYLELCEASFWILYCFTIHIDTGINTTCFKSDLCSHQSLTYHMKSPSSRKVVIVNSVAGESPNFSIQGFDQGLQAGCCSTEIQKSIQNGQMSRLCSLLYMSTVESIFFRSYWCHGLRSGVYICGKDSAIFTSSCSIKMPILL